MDVEQRQAFTQLLSKSLSSQLAAAAWCPAMDLLALVTGDGQLALHRLNWQRLWGVTPDCAIGALCWRPDGKAVGIGLEDGGFATYDAENGQVAVKTSVTPASVVAVGWVQASSGGVPCPRLGLVQGRLQRLFSPSPAPVPSPGQQPWKPYQLGTAAASSGGQQGAQHAQQQQDDDALCLVAALDAQGHVSVCSSDLLPVLALTVRPGSAAAAPGHSHDDAHHSPHFQQQRQPQQEDGGRPLFSPGGQSIALSRSLRYLWVLWHEQHSSAPGSGPAAMAAAGGGGGAGGALPQLRMYDTGKLAAHTEELSHLLGLLTRVRALAAALRATLDVAAKEWGGARRAFDERMGECAAVLADMGVTVDGEEEEGGWGAGKEPLRERSGGGSGGGGGGGAGSTAGLARELHHLLVAGAVSGAFQQFLQVKLGEPALKRLAKQVDGAAASVHALLSERVQPTLEALTFLLSELQGLAQCRPWRGALGLSGAAVDSAARAAVTMALSAEQLRCACGGVGSSYRRFFSWLLSWARVLGSSSEDDPGAARAAAGSAAAQAAPQLEAFVDGELRRDSLGPRIGCEGARPDAGPQLPPGVVTVLQAMMGHEACVSGSLRQEAEVLEQRCAELCNRLPRALSPTVTCAMHLSLAAPRAAALGGGGGGRRGAQADGCGGGAVAVLDVTQVPQQLDDGIATVAMVMVEEAGAGGGEEGEAGGERSGRHCLLVLRCTPRGPVAAAKEGGSSGGGRQQQQGGGEGGQAVAACSACAACVRMPAGVRPVQPALYRFKESEALSVVALLLQEAAGEAAGGAAQLVQVPLEGLRFVDVPLPLPPGAAAGAAGGGGRGGDEPLDLLQECQSLGGCCDLDSVPGVRLRGVGAGVDVASGAGLLLSVSGARGVAAVVRQQQEVKLFDLQEDEEDEEEEDDEDEEEDGNGEGVEGEE